MKAGCAAAVTVNTQAARAARASCDVRNGFLLGVVSGDRADEWREASDQPDLAGRAERWREGSERERADRVVRAAAAAARCAPSTGRRRARAERGRCNRSGRGATWFEYRMGKDEQEAQGLPLILY